MRKLNHYRIPRVVLYGIAIILCASQSAFCEPTPARQLDLRRLSAAGVRVVEGQFVRLVTDVPATPGINELPAVFDAAVPQWANYFGVRESKVDGQRWTAYLIADRARFAALGLLPADNPDFVNGYGRDYEVWLVEQPSDYYRRHLLLHEGTHAFMLSQLGGCGPGWYREGVAELLGTHHWSDERLRLGTFPANRADVPMWGRIKLVRDAVAAGQAWPLEAVLKVESHRVFDVDSYAWTWALCALLDGHPQFRERFRRLPQAVLEPEFNTVFRRQFADDWGDLVVEWAAYVAALDYGYDVERMAMLHRPAAEVASGQNSSLVAADRGWQSTGWLLKAGKSYRVTASGRYQIAYDDAPWPCEPNGVTIRYHDGHPLGALLGALRPVDEAGSGTFDQPLLLGADAAVTPPYDAVLYVRVNDSPAELADNAGKFSVRVEPLSDE